MISSSTECALRKSFSRIHRGRGISRFLIACLGSTSLLCYGATIGTRSAQAQDFFNTDATSGPFSSGTQNFYNNSKFDANASAATTGTSSQFFNDTSYMDVSAVGGIAGGSQTFGDTTSLHLLSSQSIVAGVQTFNGDSFVSAEAADAITGGAQTFHGDSTFVVVAGGSINGGAQEFYDDSILRLNTTTSIAGGSQYFADTSTLSVNAASAIGVSTQQVFHQTSKLDANVADAVNGGTQIFQESSALNANVSNAISNGTQKFYDNSVLNATVSQAVVGGSQNFYNDSSLKAEAAGAVGGFQNFHGNSSLQADVTGAVDGATIHLYDAASIQVNADNALTAATGVAFDDSNGGPGGTLQLNGHDTSLGTIMTINSSSAPAGIIRNGAATVATFTIDDTATGGLSTYFGVIEDGGTGRLNLRHVGSGLLYLGAANTYTGATIIESGALYLIGAGDISSSSGVELSDASSIFDIGNASGNRTIQALSGVTGSQVRLGNLELTVANTRDMEFAGTIIGTGDLIKDGDGTLNLSGSSTFTGIAHVVNGRLAVNGTLTDAVARVEQAGILGGTGTVAGILAGLGGTVAPGNSIGTLHVSGFANLNAASIYQVEVNAAGQSDLLDVTGQTIIDPGSVVRVLAAPGSYGTSTSYTILTSAGLVIGEFGGVTSNLAFLTPSLSYDPNNVYLTLASNGTSFADVAKTRNQRAAAAGAEALGSGNAVHDQILGLDAAGAQAAFDSLSGELHAATTGQLLRDARYVSDGVLGRLQQADRQSGDIAAQTLAALTPAEVTTAAGSANRLALWGQAFGGWSAVDGNGNAGQLDRSLAGLLVGLDGQVAEDWRLGLAAGYSHSDLDLNSRNSTAGIDSYHLALYGGGHVGPVALRLGASYSFNDIDSSRDVSVGSLQDHDKASYQGRTAQVFGEIGYDLQVGPVALEPFAGMAYAHLATDGFQEKGGASALKGKSSDQDLPYSTLGLRAAGEVAKVAGGSLSAHGMVGWRHAYGDVTPTADLSFSGGSGSFTVAGTPIARDALVAQAGLDLAISERLTVGLAYDGQVAGNAQDNAVQGSLSWKF